MYALNRLSLMPCRKIVAQYMVVNLHGIGLCWANCCSLSDNWFHNQPDVAKRADDDHPWQPLPVSKQRITHHHLLSWSEHTQFLFTP